MDHCLQIALHAGAEALAGRSNFIFSPVSIRAALALLAAGTNGETLRQLLSFLGSEELHLLNVANARLLSCMRVWPQVSFAAGVFVDSSLFLRPEFFYTAASLHGASSRSVDFQNETEAAEAEVNAFAARATRGRIRGIIQPGSLKSDTKMIIANAMHFRAKWAQGFNPCNTFDHRFYRLDGTAVTVVPFMSNRGDHYAASFDDDLGGFKVLQCFYRMEGPGGRLDHRGPCFCMLIFLPDRCDGLGDLLRAAATQPDFIMRCAPRREQEEDGD